jgi:hypothetical protein
MIKLMKKKYPKYDIEIVEASWQKKKYYKS